MAYYQGKTAVVTGAASGIGRALTIRMVRDGARVAAADVNAAGLDETLRLCADLPGSADKYILDVSDRAAFFAFADQVLADFGTLELVFNNAGVAQFGLARNLDIEDYEWLLGINLWGVIYGSKAFMPHMLARKSGQIVNISSVFGFVGIRGQSAYNTSKFAVRGFTESLARELVGTGVSGHCVHPGGIRTNIASDARFKDGGDLYASKEEAIKLSDKILFTAPDKAARIILRGVARNKRRIRVGVDALFYDLLARVAPVGYGRVLRLLGG